MKLTHNNLNDLINTEDGSVEELDCGYILDKTPLDKRDKLLGLILSKIKYNGNVMFNGLDIVDLARRHEIGEIDDDTYLTKLYTDRSSASSLELLSNALVQNGYQLIIKRLDSNLMEYYIHARRTKT